MKSKINIAELVEKFDCGTLTDQEWDTLLQAIDSDKLQGEVVAYYQRIWDKSSDTNREVDSKKIFEGIKEQLGNSYKPVRTPSKLHIIFRQTSRYAAVFVLAFGLSWFVSRLFNDSSPLADELVQRVEVPYGSKSKVTLPDGTIVNLNAGSTLEYSNWYADSDQRKVYLSGEGFFDVAKDPSRPFYVITPVIKVKVLGTTFNVKAYPDENIIETTLVTGEVEIYSNADTKEKNTPIVLKPNQKVEVLASVTHNNSLVQREVPKIESIRQIHFEDKPAETKKLISWKDENLVFDNVLFSDLVIRLERWYNIKIEIEYPEIRSIRLSGTFDKETIEQVMDALSALHNFNYHFDKSIIKITE